MHSQEPNGFQHLDLNDSVATRRYILEKLQALETIKVIARGLWALALALLVAGLTSLYWAGRLTENVHQLERRVNRLEDSAYRSYRTPQATPIPQAAPSPAGSSEEGL